MLIGKRKIKIFRYEIGGKGEKKGEGGEERLGKK